MLEYCILRQELKHGHTGASVLNHRLNSSIQQYQVIQPCIYKISKLPIGNIVNETNASKATYI